MQSIRTFFHHLLQIEHGQRPHERETMMQRDNSTITRAVMMLTAFPLVVAITWSTTPSAARGWFLVGVVSIVLANVAGSLPWHRWPRWLEPSMPILSVAGSWLWAASAGGFGNGYAVLAMPPLAWLASYADPPDVAAGFAVLAALALSPAHELFAGLPDPGSTDAAVVGLLVMLLVCVAIRPLVVALRGQVNAARRATWSLRASQAALAHDLRNPLTSIGALSQLALDRLQSPADLDDLDAATGYLTRISDLVRRSGQTIDGVLELSQAGDAPPAAAAFDLPDQLREIAREIPGIVLVIDGIPRTLNAHEPSIRRIFLNLFDNAARHARRGDEPVRVTVRGSESPSHWRFTVSDDGPGIAPEDAAQMFEPWHRGERNDGNLLDGAGLGLAIVAAIVDQHRGAIRLVDDGAVGGATFEFTIARRG